MYTVHNIVSMERTAGILLIHTQVEAAHNDRTAHNSRQRGFLPQDKVGQKNVEDSC